MIEHRTSIGLDEACTDNLHVKIHVRVSMLLLLAD